MNDKKKSFKKMGSMLGIGTAIGASIFAATNEPVWLAVGVALGAALSQVKRKK